MWYFTRNEKQEGPFDDQAISAVLANGTIVRETLVWRDGMADWMPLHRTDLAQLLPQHNGPPPVPKAEPSVAVTRLRDAAINAWRSFKILASDPVAKLSLAFETLGPTNALGAGIIFGMVFDLCALFAFYRVIPDIIEPHGIGAFFKLFLFGVVPFISLVGAITIGRMTFRGKGQLGHNCFLAGVSLLPLGVVLLLTGILGPANLEVIAVLALGALCLTILLLFVGMSRICNISERAATIAVPLMLISSVWLSKIIYAMIFNEFIRDSLNSFR